MPSNIFMCNSKKKVLFLYDSQMTSYAIQQLERLIKQISTKHTIIVFKTKNNDDFVIFNAIKYKKNLIVFTTYKTSDTIQDVIEYLLKKNENGLIIHHQINRYHHEKMISLADYIIVVELFDHNWQLNLIDIAINQNKPIYCLVQMINSQTINHKLIQAGAFLLENLDDLY